VNFALCQGVLVTTFSASKGQVKDPQSEPFSGPESTFSLGLPRELRLTYLGGENILADFLIARLGSINRVFKNVTVMSFFILTTWSNSA
jgi:hypothetical protein